jgi:D-alanine transaminase
MNKNIVYLNNKYIPLNKSKISVLDRGFLFADGIYEVIPIYNGKLFRSQQHLERLERSLKNIVMPSPLTQEQWDNIFNKLIKKNKAYNGNYHFYIQITRGAAKSRGHAFPDNIPPTILVILNKSTKNLPLDILKQGKSAISCEDTRWKNCHIKSIALLPNILFSEKAHAADSEEAILIRDGYAIEGASSNLFIVKNNTLITPPLSPYLLGGITRDAILELAKTNNIHYQEQPISEAELKNADEIWISSSTREIYPITKLNNNHVANGKVGPIWQRMIKLYRDACNS